MIPLSVNEFTSFSVVLSISLHHCKQAFEIIKSQNAELIDASIIKSGAWDNKNDDAFSGLILNIHSENKIITKEELLI